MSLCGLAASSLTITITLHREMGRMRQDKESKTQREEKKMFRKTFIAKFRNIGGLWSYLLGDR